MHSEQDRPLAKISYEKPTAVDLGAAAPVVGASCAPGQTFRTHCNTVGNSAVGDCDTTGNSATGSYCQDGLGFT